MASLKEVVRSYRDEIVDGIAWVAIWKVGRSWKVWAFWEESGSYDDGYEFDSYDVNRMKEIVKEDHKAICFNGYYMGFGEDFTNEEIQNKVRWFYEERRCQLHGDFLECMVIN